MKSLLLAGILVFVGGCSTVTILPKGHVELATEPTYEKSLPFFIAGVVGERDVDAKTICAGKPVRQIRTESTFLDSFFGIITIAIYAPHTVKIWCDEKGS
jgi:hypothetical protein